MLDKIKSLHAQIESATAANSEDAEALRIKYLSKKGEISQLTVDSVSYTHLTLPTNREV